MYLLTLGSVLHGLRVPRTYMVRRIVQRAVHIDAHIHTSLTR